MARLGRAVWIAIRHERDGDLFRRWTAACPSRAPGRLLGDLAGQLDQVVGGVAAGADDDEHLVAGLPGADRLARPPP